MDAPLVHALICLLSTGWCLLKPALLTHWPPMVQKMAYNWTAPCFSLALSSFSDVARRHMAA